MNETHFTITIFIVLLLIASGVAMATRWIRVPYTLALVIVGLLISPMHFIPAVHVSPELILLIFLPALLFEAAWNLRLDHLRENLAPILTLAVPGVLLSVGVVGAVMHFGVGWPWPSALLFGAIISATDPVSVLALFKKLGLPKRLNTIVEGESLINDGTAVVVFKIILAIAAGATMETPMGGLALDSLRDFIKVVFGGLAVGAVVGLTGEETLYLQGALILKAGGASAEQLAIQRATQEGMFKILKEEKDPATTENRVREELSRNMTEEEKKKSEQAIASQIKRANTPWFRYFLTLDPRPALRKVKCPVLALNGENDLQVPATENLREIEGALKAGGNKDVTIVSLPKLNHLFQTSETGSLSEYAKIEETIAPVALKTIGDWILKRTTTQR